jgi:glycosyltransferase involved in cell wall biosynthesis
MSVIGQADDVDLEILIGDDLSEDGTQAIVEALATQFPSIVRYHRNTARLGPAGNYLSLIARARGKYIAHLDGDDLWFPGKLSAQVAYLDQHPDSPAVYTNALTMRDDGASLGLFNNTQQERINIDYLVIRGNFLCHSSVLYRATMQTDVLALPVPFIDYRIHLLLALHGDLGYINETLVNYRVHSVGSMLIHSNDQVRKLYWEAVLSIPRAATSKKALAGCMAEFGRSVFFSSLKKRKKALLLKWFPKVIEFSPVGQARMILLMITAIIRVGIQELMQTFRSRLSDKYPRVLYFR